MNRNAKTVKSIVKLKEELGPITEEVKADIEQGMNELTSIVRKKRDLMVTLLMEKNKDQYRQIRDVVELNRVYLDMDADPTTGQSSVLKRMTKVDEKSLITFEGFVDVLKSFELRISTKVLKHIVDKLTVYSWRLDTV